MAHALRFMVTVEVNINESEYALLSFLERQETRVQEPRAFTASTLATAINMSVSTARRSSYKLVRTGLVVMRGQQREDGGCDANTYEVTRLGREVLKCPPLPRPYRVASVGKRA